MMKTRHRVARGMSSQLAGSTIEKKIAKVTVGKSTGGSVRLVRERYVVAGGHRFYCLEAGRGPLVLLCHGFPELAYSWRHQIDALADAGFHVVAPDMPGYGRSDKPDVVYDIDFLNGCLGAIIESLGHDRAVLAGHDWGGLIVWQFARRYPERTAGVIGVNTPDLPRPPVPPVELMRQIFVDTPIYIIQFQEPGLAEWVFSWGRGADDFVDMIFLNEMNRNPGRVHARGARGLQAGVASGRRVHSADRVLPQHGPQLAPDGGVRGPHDRRAVPDDQCRERPGAQPRDVGRHGGARAEPRARADPRLRTLDDAGTATGDDRSDARLSHRAHAVGVKRSSRR